MLDGSKSQCLLDFIKFTHGTWLFSKSGIIEGKFRVQSQTGNYSEYLKYKSQPT